MRMRKTLITLTATVALMGGIERAAFAEATPYVMPQDTRIVVFRYDPNQTYTIFSRVGEPTSIQLGPDEKLEKFILGDTVRWVVADTSRMLFVKPVEDNLYTAGTIVTNKRDYQVQFRSVPATGVWYQKVSWKYPSLIALSAKRQKQARLAQEKAAREKAARIAGEGLNPDALNFNYQIQGDKGLAPEQVFDDGKFTWIQMGDLQTLPALFVEDGGKPALVNYVVKGRYLVVQRLFGRAILKRGERQAVIVNRNARSLRKTLDRVAPEQSTDTPLDWDF